MMAGGIGWWGLTIDDERSGYGCTRACGFAGQPLHGTGRLIGLRHGWTKDAVTVLCGWWGGSSGSRLDAPESGHEGVLLLDCITGPDSRHHAVPNQGAQRQELASQGSAPSASALPPTYYIEKFGPRSPENKALRCTDNEVSHFGGRSHLGDCFDLKSPQIARRVPPCSSKPAVVFRLFASLDLPNICAKHTPSATTLI